MHACSSPPRLFFLCKHYVSDVHLYTSAGAVYSRGTDRQEDSGECRIGVDNGIPLSFSLNVGFYFLAVTEALEDHIRDLLTLRGSAQNIQMEPPPFHPRYHAEPAAFMQSLCRGYYIDKTEAYCKGLGWKQADDEFDHLGIRLCCYPRRFGKTQFLYFLKYTLGIPEGWRNDISEFYRHVSSLEQGKRFLRCPLRPVVYISFNGISTPLDLKMTICNAFKESLGGIGSRSLYKDVEEHLGDWTTTMVYTSCLNKVHDVLRRLRSDRLDDDKWKVEKPLVLLDEADCPWRDHVIHNFFASCPVAPTEDQLLLWNACDEFYKCLKTVCSDKLSGIVMITLFRIGGTGLSTLSISVDTSVSQDYHGLVGITEAELSKMLDRNTGSTYSGYIQWDDLIRWGEATNIIDRVRGTRIQASADRAKTAILTKLESTINGFCSALDRPDQVESVYSPMDMIKLLEHVHKCKNL